MNNTTLLVLDNLHSSALTRILLILLLCLMFTTLIWAESIIDKIEIIGNKTVTERTIREKIKMKKNAIFTEDAMKEDIVNIVSLGTIEEVIPEVNDVDGKVTVTFQIVEKPQLRKIEFKGNRNLSNGKLKSELTLKEQEHFDVTKAEEDLNKIVTLYRDKGYADCKVEYSHAPDTKKGGLILTFLITEGNRIVVKAINVIGTHVYSPRKIISLMKTKPKKGYKEADFVADKDTLINFYKNRGFLRMELSEPEITYNEARTEMLINLTLHEGAQFRIGKVVFSGNTLFTEKELLRNIELKNKELFQQEKYDLSLMNLQTLYSDKGYLQAQIKPEILENEESAQVDIVYHITENEPVYVNRVFIEGTSYTKKYVLDRELLVRPGSVLYASNVRRSLEKLYNLGFLEEVKPDVQPTNQPNQVDVVFIVTEGRPGIMSAGAGYSSTDQLVGTLQVQHLNLLGRAYRLNLLWEFGARRQNYEIGFTDPWFLNKPVSLGVDLFNTDRKRQYDTDINAYWERRKGLALRFGPRITEYFSLNFAYSYEQIEIHDVRPDLIDKLQGFPLVSSITAGIVRDSRDNIFDASRGSRNSLSFQYAGGVLGGDANYFKPTFTTAWFFPTFWKLVFSLSARGGLLKEIGTTKVYNEYYYLGGADTVRGYDYGEISPYGGGKVMLIFNAEYKFPISQEKGRTILQGAFFVDVGGAWEKESDVNLNIGTMPGWMKAGAGFGIRLTTPVFPLRFDWGYGLHKTTGNPLQFYFSIGNIF